MEQQVIDNKTLRKNILEMLWPATLESVLQMMVGIVATAMVGRLGATAIGAVGLANRVSQVVWAIFQAVGTGATVLVARAIGEGNDSLARKVSYQALMLGMILVVSVTAVIFILAGPILGWFGARESLYLTSFNYLRLVVFAMPFMSIMQIVGAILRGSGNTRTPMVVAFIMNVINIAVSYVLIFGKFGMPELGVYGAAWGAIISQAISSVIAIWILMQPRSVVSLRKLTSRSIDFNEIRRLMKVGVPVAGESLFWQFATIIITKWIVSFGEVSLAAHQLGLQAESLSYMPGVGFSIAATAFVGQSLGRKDTDLAMRYAREILRFCMILTAFTASLLFFFPRQILSVFTTEIDVIELAKYYLIFMAVIQIPQQVTSTMIGVLRGAGVTKPAMINAGIGIWLIRVPFSYILGVHMGYGVIGVWLAISLDVIIRFFLNWRIYRRDDWKYAEIN